MDDKQWVGHQPNQKGSALSRNLKALVTRVVDEGVGPLTGSVAYAHERFRDPQGNAVPPPTSEDDGFAYAGSPEAEEAIRRIIRESCAAAGTQGFITGLGGLLTLPVSLPANTAGNLIINSRMVGSIAYLRGYKVSDPHTQAMLMLVVAGSSAQTAMSALGLNIGKNVTKQAIASIPISLIREINKRVGFMLVAKYGVKRAPVTLAKGVPLVGGFVGGGVDAALTGFIGKTAKKVFPA